MKNRADACLGQEFELQYQDDVFIKLNRMHSQALSRTGPIDAVVDGGHIETFGVTLQRTGRKGDHRYTGSQHLLRIVSAGFNVEDKNNRMQEGTQPSQTSNERTVVFFSTIIVLIICFSMIHQIFRGLQQPKQDKGPRMRYCTYSPWLVTTITNFKITSLRMCMT